MEESDRLAESETTYYTEEQTIEQEKESNNHSYHEPLLKRNHALSASPHAIIGAKVSNIESLDYEINENDLFKHDWRSRSKGQVLQYIFLKWFQAFLVGILTGIIATLINLAVENIAGYKLLAVFHYIEKKRYIMGFFFMAGVNFLLTLVATTLCALFAPTAAGPGAPEIKAYLNGVDTPNMYGATTMFVKIIGSVCVVSAGLDLGKEGPLIHIGACIASLIGQGGPDRYQIQHPWIRQFNNDRDRRDIITYGVSSGVCAAFRAPVGGVLFALEEVATWWRSALLWRTFFSTAVVVVVLRSSMEYCKGGGCGLFGEGGLIMFDVSGVSVMYHVVDLIPVVVIGIIGNGELRLAKIITKSIPLYYSPLHANMDYIPWASYSGVHPKPWMRNITVGELATVKPPVVTLSGIEKVSRIVEVLQNTAHNGFPVVENITVPHVGQVSEVCGTVLRAHLLLALKKKWLMKEKRRTEEWEITGKITCADVSERCGKYDEVAVTKEEMDMYVDLNPLTNQTPHTVVETMSVAKAMVQFREVGLRHMLVLPKHHGPAMIEILGFLFYSPEAMFLLLGSATGGDLDQARLKGPQHSECFSSFGELP
ncbi:chloride channel protein CLC-b-like protein [Tanacetum coccineum]